MILVENFLASYILVCIKPVVGQAIARQTTEKEIVLLLAVDGLATGTVALGEVTALEHELRDDAVETGASIPKSLLASAESAEVLSGNRDNVLVERHDDTLYDIRFKPTVGRSSLITELLHQWLIQALCGEEAGPLWNTYAGRLPINGNVEENWKQSSQWKEKSNF